MHYYKFNIKDWTRDTAHLSVEEEGVYRRLLDHYYESEKPIPQETKSVIRRLRLAGHEESVGVILGEFFTLESDGYHHHRCDEEIAKYHLAKKNHWGTRLSKSERCAIQAARNTAKINATPAWLSLKQRNDIAAIYADAAIQTAQTGIPHEVDHIVPLRGKQVCGLHVAWNLRVITASENRAKSNSLEVL